MKEACHILLVEDDEDDRLLFQDALRASKSPHCIDFAKSVPEAKDFLGESTDFPRVILCDLWLGAESGLDFLRWLRQSETYRLIPFVLMGTSLSPDHLQEAYECGANSCLLKPSDLQAWDEAVRLLLKFWCDFTTTPKSASYKTRQGSAELPS